MESLEQVFANTYYDYLTTIKICSYNDNEKHYLLNIEHEAYNFDKLERINKNALKSVDSIVFKDKNMYFIEYKDQSYEIIKKEAIFDKITNSLLEMYMICEQYNCPFDYQKIYIVVYSNKKSNSRTQINRLNNYASRLSNKPIVKFNLERLMPRYVHKIYTIDDVEFTKHFDKIII